MDEREIQKLSIDTIRGLAMDAVQKANAGHPGTAMALAPLGYTLFKRFLAVDPAAPDWPDRDRFVLSAGHACVLQYSLLHLTGFDLSLDDLKQFRQWGSRTPGHPERSHTPGVEITTGPLGQGVANAVGMAMAERFLDERFSRPGSPIVDHHIYVICSDGDMMEGISQEAASVAGHLGLGKLIVCYDDNRITIDGSTSLSFDGENHLARFQADGWHGQRVEDSEDVDALTAALEAARAESERPSFISIRSHIAFPAPNAIDTAKAHGAPLGEEEVKATKRVMGFDPEQTFWVDERVYEHMSLRESRRGGAVGVDGSASATGASASRSWRRTGIWRGRGSCARAGSEALPRFAPGEAPRDARGGQEDDGGLLGVRADDARRRGRPGGVDEHGLQGRGRVLARALRSQHRVRDPRARDGCDRQRRAVRTAGIVKPYGSTFLIFSDYMRGAVRLSALMGLPVVWVWTHDSVAVGEDGPTHEPVEQYASLRAIPHLWVIRPSDANETAVAWQVALERRTARWRCCSRARASRCSTARRWPGGGAQTRRIRPVGVRRRGGAGADPASPPARRCGLTLEAGRQLAREGRAVRVVAMPCMELFEEQPRGLPQSGASAGDRPPAWRSSRARRMSWWKWVGTDGDVLGIDHFGASAPGRDRAQGVRLHGREHRSPSACAAGAPTMTREQMSRATERSARCNPIEHANEKESEMPSDADRAARTPVGPRTERVDRQSLARIDPRRASAEPDRRLLGRGSDVEPDDLPEGDDDGGCL